MERPKRKRTMKGNFNKVTDEFQKLTGSRLNVKGVYKYPSVLPFSGELIDLKNLPASTQKAHIRLKNALCYVLRNSCSHRIDIKNTDWSFPGDKLSRHANPHPFPSEFYHSLRDMFAEYFTVADEELDTLWKDEYEALQILEPFSNIQSKKAAFKQLSTARNTYLTKTFPEEFRAAMTEIRHSSYDPVTGTWTNRKRGFPRSSNGNDKENEGDKRKNSSSKSLKKLKSSEMVQTQRNPSQDNS